MTKTASLICTSDHVPLLVSVMILNPLVSCYHCFYMVPCMKNTRFLSTWEAFPSQGMRHAKVTFPFSSLRIVPVAIRNFPPKIKICIEFPKNPDHHQCPPGQDSWELVTTGPTQTTAAKQKENDQRPSQEKPGERWVSESWVFYGTITNRILIWFRQMLH